MSSRSSSQAPTVSVILSVRNGEPYLKLAIDSILAQSFGDFELIVVDNHSTDRTAQIIASYDDERIVPTSPPKPLHLAQALNHAGAKARGEFVARMDADDISHPSRLERQVQFMREHPNVGILGSQVRPIDGSGRLITGGNYLKPQAHADIAWSLFFGCSLWHPTVMFRKALMDSLGWYGSPAIAGREEYSTEDYDLWCRAIPHTEIRNLPEVLLDYRIHEANHSLASSRRKEHFRNLVLILSRHLKNSIGMDVSHAVCAAMLGIKPGDVADLDDVSFDCQKSRQLIGEILHQAKANQVSSDAMNQLRGKLSGVAETAIWHRGFNVMRECTALCKVDWRMGTKVMLSSIKRFM